MPAPSTRRWVLPVAFLAAVAVLVAGGVWLNLRRGAAPGTQVEESSLVLLDDGDALPDQVVRLPIGDLTLSASRPLEELPGGVGDSDAPHRVAGFGRWTAVGWQLRPGRAIQGQAVAARGEQPQFSVVLVADGVRHDLAAGSTDRDGSRAGGIRRDKTVYLALPGAPRALTVEVGFAGVVQVLDPRSGELRTGAAAPLYAGSMIWSARAPACASKRAEVSIPGFGSAPDEDLTVGCEIGAGTSVPYVTGPGWAKPGRTWLVLPVTTSASAGLFVNWPTFEATPNALYVLRLRSSSLTVAGAPPAASLTYYQGTPAELLAKGLTGAYYVFDVAPGAPVRAVLSQVYADDTPPDADDPPNAPRSARGTLSIPIDLTPAP